MNKVSINCIVALDIIEFSKKSVTLRREIKHQFDDLINLAIKDIQEKNRHVAYTEQGAVIACVGTSEDALEDALFISLTIRDAILENNTNSLKPWYVQFGIGLAYTKGDKQNRHTANPADEEDVNKVSLVMSFANPNQILVSQAYYDQATMLSQDIFKMFEQYDLHTHDEDIYAVRPFKSQAEDKAAAAILVSESKTKQTTWTLASSLTHFNWVYLAVLCMLAAFFIIYGKLLKPIEPPIALEHSINTKDQLDLVNKVLDFPDKADESIDSNTLNTSEKNKKPAKDKRVSKKVVKKLANKPKVSTKDNESTADNGTKILVNNSPTSIADKIIDNNKSSGEASKESARQECTQGEIALNQCSK